MRDVGARARSAGVFAFVSVSDDGIECRAAGPESAAWYRVRAEDDGIWISLVTKDRWLSESIEADLLHTGDKIEDLIEEELVDLGCEGWRPRCEHFRSKELEFTFRSRVQVDPAADPGEHETHLVATALLAYEACFRHLGDMSGESDT